MSLASQNVRVAVTGAISVAPTATAAPTTASSSLNVAFKDLGYVNEDGVTETRDRSTESIKAWQNADEVRKSVTESSLVYKLTLIETKKETVELFYSGTVSGTDGSLVIIPANTGGRKAFVLDIIDDTVHIRLWIPQGEITEIGDVVYANGEPIGYEITITAYPDSGIGGSAKRWDTSLVTA